MLDRKLLIAYIRQQKQLGVADFIFKKELVHSLGLKRVNPLTAKKTPAVSSFQVSKQSTATVIKKAVQEAVSQQKNDSSGSIHSRLSSLRPVQTLIPPKTKHEEKNVELLSESGKPKRELLKELFSAGCGACHLVSTRNKWVFGAGNAEAPVMVIGEAPGVEEDAQGLPFVGAAGQLLTSMLSAIKLDRNKDIFITNVLKCRPPENRNPESAEIQVCLPLLKKQIAIIQPKAILLLGRISAHALLGVGESIANLRSKVHDYKGIPVMVIYHPAALLRNAQYKRPAWEDLQKFEALLENLGIYGSSKQS